jgi:putative acetyltransferase
VRTVHERAFGQPQEAKLVDDLRGSARPLVALVAESASGIIGQILFSPVTLEPSVDTLCGMGLAPLAVLPEFQRRGVGSQLVRAGLEACRRVGVDFVVVVGHAEYYPRFGFAPAMARGLTCEYPVPEDVFQVLELRPSSLAGVTGRVRYAPAFRQS